MRAAARSRKRTISPTCTGTPRQTSVSRPFHAGRATILPGTGLLTSIACASGAWVREPNHRRSEVAGDRPLRPRYDGDGGIEDVGQDLVAHDLLGCAHEGHAPVLQSTDL